MLWRLIGRHDVLFSTTVLLGGLLFGWDVFNVMDAVFNHYLFRLHNVREQVANPELWNHGFLLAGLLQAAVGWAIIQRGRRTLVAAA